MGKGVSQKKDVDMEMVYAALITFPDDDDAIRFLDERGFHEVSKAKMAVFRRGTTMPTSPYFRPYQERREKLAPILQQKLEQDLLDVANTSTTAVQFAVDQASERLANGECKDPARVARDLMQVTTQAVDKRQLLRGQPTAIVQDRSADQIVAELERLGVVKQIDAEATAIEETSGTDG